MKRDMNLVRMILRQLESADPSRGPIAVEFRDEGFDDATVFEHVHLMMEAGLLDGKLMDGSPAPGYVPRMAIRGLSWSGHDFLANAADESRWREATAFVAKKAGPVAFDVLAEVLAKMARASLGLP